MANPLKQLAGETAIYGLSTILARVINFLLVPLYTRVLTQSEYGVATEFLAYIAILQVVLVLGLETGCFRFATKDGVNKSSIFSSAFATTSLLSGLFFALMIIFADPISSSMGYAGYSNCIIYVGGILFMDCSTSIIFAKLRFEHKALKFAVIKTIKILTETCGNLLLFLALPKYLANNPNSFITNFISPTPDFSYVIFAIFVSCIVCVILLLPEILRLKFSMDINLLKKLLAYSLPLMIAGLPGIFNDFIDRILMRFLCEESIWRADLGVYQAGVKIAVIMSLFVQMFRYAAEPFFFQRQKEKESKLIYAEVMNYFVGFCMLVFLGVVLYIDLIGLFLGRDFRVGLSIAPIMLFAYMVLGMLFNVDMWYKLAGKTSYAIYITISGLIVTVILNIIFMPKFSYHAAAWAHLASYLVMLITSLIMGRKYYPIDYNWKKIISLIAIGLAIFGASTIFGEMQLGWKLAIHTVLILIYLAIWIIIERKNIKKLIKN